MRPNESDSYTTLRLNLTRLDPAAALNRSHRSNALRQPWTGPFTLDNTARNPAAIRNSMDEPWRQNKADLNAARPGGRTHRFIDRAKPCGRTGLNRRTDPTPCGSTLRVYTGPCGLTDQIILLHALAAIRACPKLHPAARRITFAQDKPWRQIGTIPIRTLRTPAA